MRRFTRQTNAFAKKFENHVHMVALYTVWYNFVRTHKAHRMSPAMAADICRAVVGDEGYCSAVVRLAQTHNLETPTHEFVWRTLHPYLKGKPT